MAKDDRKKSSKKHNFCEENKKYVEQESEADEIEKQIKALKKENEELKMENEILKKPKHTFQSAMVGINRIRQTDVRSTAVGKRT